MAVDETDSVAPRVAQSRLLERQLRRIFGIAPGRDLEDALLPLLAAGAPVDELLRFLYTVDDTYLQYERDLALKTRSLSLTSDELLAANAKLQAQLAARDDVLASLRATASLLVGEPGADEPGRDPLAALSESIPRLIAERLRFETALHDKERRFRSLIDRAGDGLFICDPRGKIHDVNETACRMLGYSRDELLALRIADIDLAIAALPGAEVHALVEAAEHEEKLFIGRQRRKDGRIFPVEVRISSMSIDAARFVIAVARDITDRLETATRQRLAASVFDNCSEGIMITDAELRIVAVNAAFSLVTGYGEAEAIGQTPRLLKSGRQPPEFYAAMWAELNGSGRWRGEIWNRRKNGQVYPEWLSISTVRDESDRLTHYVAIFADITEMKHSQEQLTFLAHHDPLTRLPNRLLFRERLEHALLRGRRDGSELSILFIDLDHFKNVNDSLGHKIGDALLVDVANALSAQLRKHDTLARLGGDEFVLLVEGCDRAHAGQIADKLLQTVARTFRVSGHDLLLSASIGISQFPHDADDSDSLLMNADTAMYHAKAGGRNTHRAYVKEMTASANMRLMLEQLLRRSRENDELTLHFQPLFDASGSRLIGAEALARWNNPVLGAVSPARFIPVAEDSGFIVPLGLWVLETACRQFMEWRAAGFLLPCIAVNVSAQQIARGGFVEAVAAILARTGMPGDRLEFELTESTLMDAALVTPTMTQLHRLGIRFSIDDFGTGYSSLSYLKNLPIQKFKIDRSFVLDIGSNPSGEAIIRSIISLARHLGLAVLAEGVETESQSAFLRHEGCDELQGYLLGRPAPAGEFCLAYRKLPHA